MLHLIVGRVAVSAVLNGTVVSSCVGMCEFSMKGAGGAKVGHLGYGGRMTLAASHGNPMISSASEPLLGLERNGRVAGTASTSRYRRTKTALSGEEI